MQPIHIDCFQTALGTLLGRPVDGAMTYIRCLDRSKLELLVGADGLRLHGWSVFAVSDLEGESPWIATDRAVELRESRIGSALLLVDASTAGAGMDGIYGATHEIPETSLLKALQTAALERLPHGTKRIVRSAVRSARKLGGRQMVGPWREFAYLARCAADAENVGLHVSLLGLWPIGSGVVPSERDLEIAAGITSRLLLDRSAVNTVDARVDALMIPAENQDSTKQLVEFLHENAHLIWQDVCCTAAQQTHQVLWLTSLCPGFADPNIQAINLTPWRGANGKLLKWSGLHQLDEERGLVYNVPDEGTPNPAKITVRWQTRPGKLPKGTLNYRVSILKGEEEPLLEKLVAHSGNAGFEKCTFTPEDFDEYREDGGTWDVHIVVRPEAHESEATDGESDPLCAVTEPFTITFQQSDVSDESESTSAREVRSMAEFAIQLKDDDLESAVSAPCDMVKEYIVLRAGRRSGKLFRPPLLASLEASWKQNDYGIGHWLVQVRDDGAISAEPQFQCLHEENIEENARSRVAEVSRRIAKKSESRRGFLGLLHGDNDADAYVNAWIAAMKVARPAAACANTALICDQQGKARGRLVLPWHPLRVAWQQAFDRLALHCRFNENLPLGRTQDLIKLLDSSYFPLFLPGTEPGESYVFGDVLGFHTVAMLHWNEPEPQAALALMARCLYPKTDQVCGLVGFSAAEAIGREVVRFADLHPECHLAKVNALRAGDGLTLTRALGHALASRAVNSDDDDEAVSEGLNGYFLNLHPSTQNGGARLVGRHLVETSQRRRAGGKSVTLSDRWMLDSYMKGGIPLPRLQWRRCKEPMPFEPAHLAVAFDTFESRLTTVEESELGDNRAIEGYGLFAPISRKFSNAPLPGWRTTLSPSMEGLKHPAGRPYSDRLHELHSQLMRLTATHLGGGEGSWPTLITEISGERADALQRLHEMHEWVLTVDRNAGLEYFDSPRDNPDVYDTYVIDSVPEREDIDSVRLVTSTCQIEELRRLLNDALAEMGLSSSPRNCLEVLAGLKAISGRLAMRLASSGTSRQELIALALLTDLSLQCIDQEEIPWPSLTRGFFVPLDDVRDLLLGGSGSIGAKSSVRADLLHIEMAGRSGLAWTFIEVKYRRLLRSARERQVLERIDEQTSESASAMQHWYFGDDVHEVEKVIRRKRLVRALQFYADKARRHHLGEDAYLKLSTALRKLLRPDQGEDEKLEVKRCGFVFCPEFRGQVESLSSDEGLPVHLFGPDFLSPSTRPPRTLARESFEEPSPHEDFIASPVTMPDVTQAEEYAEQTATGLNTSNPTAEAESAVAQAKPSTDTVRHEAKPILLGENERTGESVTWNPTIRGNPHLMIVGLPGMGKTECIVNLCVQLAESGIRPVVFAYHDDIEERLTRRCGSIKPMDVQAGLGFNPMVIVGRHPHAWVDHVGMLRDIFACIFPDFGDRQTNEIREALKKSYIEAGYNQANADLETLTPPTFRRFFLIIKGSAKPNPGVLERLTELDDYGFFQTEGQAATILQGGPPAVIRLHSTRNEVLQRALASFVLLHAYQNMFIRGEQQWLTHAVIFDEAHRASRLKLIATMAKECRKYGISLIVSSQAVKDFDTGLFSAIANYLTLRMTEVDALALAKNVGASDDARRLAGQLKKLEKFHGLFFREGHRETLISLSTPPA